MPAMSEDAIGTALKSLRHPWRLEDEALVLDLQFKTFIQAFAFMTAIALEAEKINHHPQWTNVYNRVSIRLWTHDAGGITDLDFRLAHAIEVYAP